jgi:CheY-like chemotaxis protein
VATQIKADPELSKVPVIFLTAIVSPKEARHEKAIGGFPFLAKPVSVDAIVHAVETHCPPGKAA